jgi:hypothetical protein
MELILQTLCKSNVVIIILGDSNVNYLGDCSRKRELEDLFTFF